MRWGRQPTSPETCCRCRASRRITMAAPSGLLELTLHNAMEARLANASPQEHIDAHLAEGKKFLAENRYGEAERELAEVVSLSPDDPQAHILLAQALEAEGKHQEAAGELQTSLKLKDTAPKRTFLWRAFIFP